MRRSVAVIVLAACLAAAPVSAATPGAPEERRRDGRDAPLPPPLGRAAAGRFSIQQLLQDKFPYRVSNDVDMDPCKGDGFYGDIAMPNVVYELEKELQDARAGLAAQQEKEKKRRPSGRGRGGGRSRGRARGQRLGYPPGLIGAVALSWCEEPYIVEDFNVLPNVYFDHMGPARLFHQEWKIVIYYDTEEVIASERLLLHQVSSLQDANFQTEKPLIDFYVNRFTKWREYRLNLLTSIGIVHNNHARGWFNFIGDISKTLFGTLSQEDAEYYNQEIDKIIETNNKLAALIHNETHILKSTVINNALFKSSIDETIILLTRRINDSLKSAYTELDRIKALINLGQLVNMYAESVRMLETIILHAEQGQVHPDLIPYQNLLDVIHEIAKTYGQNQLIAAPILKHLFLFLQASTINIAVLKQRYICFEIRIPILEETQYLLNHLLSLPSLDQSRIGNKFIQIETPYVLMDLTSHSFIPSSYLEIQECKKIKNVHICKRTVPRFSISLQDPCLRLAMKTLSGPVDNLCHVGLIRFNHTIWYQLYENNVWIGIAPNQEFMQISCKNGFHETVSKRGVFKISLDPGCVLLSSTATLYATSEHTQEKLNLNLGLPSSTQVLSDNLTLVYIPEIKESLIHRDSLQSKLRDLSSISNEAESLESKYRN